MIDRPALLRRGEIRMAPGDPRIGQTVGGYTLEALIGRGGMGAVYLADQHAIQRKVAVKVIADDLAGDPRVDARFLREARLAAQINHPHVVPVYDAGRDDDGTLYLAMRYIPGGDLGKLLRECGALSIGSALDVATAIARALAAGHAHGLVHRDVKPPNILLESAAGNLHPYLSDFGLSTLVGHRSSISSAAGMVGTLHYMAPEQIR